MSRKRIMNRVEIDLGGRNGKVIKAVEHIPSDDNMLYLGGEYGEKIFALKSEIVNGISNGETMIVLDEKRHFSGQHKNALIKNGYNVYEVNVRGDAKDTIPILNYIIEGDDYIIGQSVSEAIASAVKYVKGGQEEAAAETIWVRNLVNYAIQVATAKTEDVNKIKEELLDALTESNKYVQENKEALCKAIIEENNVTKEEAEQKYEKLLNTVKDIVFQITNRYIHVFSQATGASVDIEKIATGNEKAVIFINKSDYDKSDAIAVNIIVSYIYERLMSFWAVGHIYAGKLVPKIRFIIDEEYAADCLADAISKHSTNRHKNVRYSFWLEHPEEMRENHLGVLTEICRVFLTSGQEI